MGGDASNSPPPLPILFCVDELADYKEKPMETCAILTRELSRDPHLELIVSTLEASRARGMSDGSTTRRVQWLPLPPLTFAGAQSLFADVKLRDKRLLRVLITDCGGHPRWLTALHDTLTNVRTGWGRVQR